MSEKSIDIRRHIEIAQQYYRDEPPYQDKAHLQASLASAEELLDINRRHLHAGTTGLAAAVLLGVAYHGANAHLPHQTFHFPTKQDFAAAVAEVQLIEEIDKTELAGVMANIRATRPQASRQTIGEVLTHQAVNGYAAARNYSEFKAWVEYGWQTQERLDWDAFREEKIALGQKAVASSRTEFLRVGLSRQACEQWVDRKERNLQLLGADTKPRVIS